MFGRDQERRVSVPSKVQIWSNITSGYKGSGLGSPRGTLPLGNCETFNEFMTLYWEYVEGTQGKVTRIAHCG